MDIIRTIYDCTENVLTDFLGLIQPKLHNTVDKFPIVCGKNKDWSIQIDDPEVRDKCSCSPYSLVCVVINDVAYSFPHFSFDPELCDYKTSKLSKIIFKYMLNHTHIHIDISSANPFTDDIDIDTHVHVVNNLPPKIIKYISKKIIDIITFELPELIQDKINSTEDYYNVCDIYNYYIKHYSVRDDYCEFEHKKIQLSPSSCAHDNKLLTFINKPDCVDKYHASIYLYRYGCDAGEHNLIVPVYSIELYHIYDECFQYLFLYNNSDNSFANINIKKQISAYIDNFIKNIHENKNMKYYLITFNDTHANADIESFLNNDTVRHIPKKYITIIQSNM